MPRLSRKVALVTGAARGMGAATARAYSVEVGVARAGRPGAAWIPLDVRDEPAWADTLARIVSSPGRLDVLVDNAGITGLEAGAPHDDPAHATLVHVCRPCPCAAAR
jgi:3(or 17)beta-hydroxysteroid dehydrogenase